MGIVAMGREKMLTMKPGKKELTKGLQGDYKRLQLGKQEIRPILTI